VRGVPSGNERASEGKRTENRGQKTEVRSQRSEVRGQRSEGKNQRDEKTGTGAVDIPFRDSRVSEGKRTETSKKYIVVSEVVTR
jgi:hypothetical protein